LPPRLIFADEQIHHHIVPEGVILDLYGQLALLEFQQAAELPLRGFLSRFVLTVSGIDDQQDHREDAHDQGHQYGS
jgi:hypothetical protein